MAAVRHDLVLYQIDTEVNAVEYNGRRREVRMAREVAGIHMERDQAACYCDADCVPSRRTRVSPFDLHPHPRLQRDLCEQSELADDVACIELHEAEV